MGACIQIIGRVTEAPRARRGGWTFLVATNHVRDGAEAAAELSADDLIVDVLEVHLLAPLSVDTVPLAALTVDSLVAVDGFLDADTGIVATAVEVFPKPTRKALFAALRARQERDRATRALVAAVTTSASL